MFTKTMSGVKQMMKEKRLPHNNKEGILYGSVICTCTVIFMVLLNTYINVGHITYQELPTMLKLFCILFIIAMFLENFIVSHFAHKMKSFFCCEEDSFNSQILFNVLFTVIGMSVLMTLIASYISSGFNLQSLTFGHFISNWPKNFSIVFAFELLIAQPIARKFMVLIHK